MLKEIIKKIENYNGKKYYELHSIINRDIEYLKENKEDIPSDILAEYLAFLLIPSHSGISSWGTYYGPFAIFNNGDGTSTETPGRNFITKEIITVWERRISETNNIFLKYRYLDLIYDLKEKFTNEKLNFSFKINLIDTGIEGIKNDIFSKLDGKNILKRLLDIVILLSQKDKVKELIKLIIQYEKKISEDDKPGLWGFSYDYLMYNKKINLSTDDENIIIEDLENKITKLDNPFHIEHCLNRLGEYYKNVKRYDDLLKILLLYEKSYKDYEYSNSDGLLISTYYQELIDIFSYYSVCSEDIKIEKERLIREFQLKSKDNLNSFKELSVNFTITDKQMKDYVDYFFSEKEKIIQKIVLHSLPSITQTKKQLDDLVKEFPISYMINHQLYDNNGFPVYTFGSIEEDYDSHLYSLMSQNLHTSSIFINEVLNKFITIYSLDDLLLELYKGILFLEEDKDFLFKMLNNYYNGNYCEFNFLAVPYIEKNIRYLCELNGFVIVTKKNNGMEIKSLDSLINNDIIKTIYGKYGGDFVVYLRILLTLKVGWNIRNNLAHGININYLSNKRVSDRLMHILLSLSLIISNK